MALAVHLEVGRQLGNPQREVLTDDPYSDQLSFNTPLPGCALHLRQDRRCNN